MEFLKGKTIDKYDEESYDLFVVLYRLKNMISLVNDFHRVGLLHRDLKGANIFSIPDETSFD